ncbi:carboxy terminal-processing peptidase [Paraflavitalea sp. CAU 1676]|uniref:carboxy terminal-processing peptidase n=1 Tax=Paraflavitalea sp. CAU 1676 TaxID=3032598 RepID=UPI0023D9B4F0|nr:carboxy terminal-processing peptidase [Paraflavitalea sp. CAU 1676]MDF2187876.1 carboxy terminal-processing peptidase [Paraflavitalea sp. CAU 1676]
MIMRSGFQLAICTCLLLVAQSPSSFAQKSKVTENVDLVFHNTTDMLQHIHYAPKKLDDKFSAQVFTAYLEQLDPGKRLFLREDLQEFKKYQSQLDDEMKGKVVQFYKVVNTTFRQRLKDAETTMEELLKQPFKFNTNEVYNSNTEKLDYCKSVDDLNKRWQNYLKFQVLGQYEDMLDIHARDTANKLSDAQMEEKARETILRIEKRNFANLQKLTTDEEAFNTYVNSITNLYDPHSNYFLPVDRREFQESLSGVYYGIGALLQDMQGKIGIAELMIGGPAWKSGQVEKGDVIVKVAQGGGKPADVAGLAMSEVIKLTRGQQGTTVTITFRKQDGSLKDVTLKREALQLEDTFVKSAIIEDSVKLGYISFPKFYTDFGDANGRSCAADMARELARLQQENVKGIIIDIRDNIGGSLGEVINMIGLFIKEGPVVQVKGPVGEPYVSRVKGKTALYDGPLVVLVNEMSASAAEIFAAAIQDYHRGIIIGSSSTYGKGSVQRPFGIGDNRVGGGNPNTDLGTLHVTLQKYYRITGAATQLKGIEPDIKLPGIYEPYKMQEKNNPTALAWDTIQAVPFETLDGQGVISKTVAMAGPRMQQDTTLLSLSKNLHWMQSRNGIYALQLDKYRTQEKEVQTKVGEIRKQLVSAKPMGVKNTTDMEESLKSKEQFKNESNKAWINSLKRDLFLSEAVYVMYDFLKLANS